MGRLDEQLRNVPRPIGLGLGLGLASRIIKNRGFFDIAVSDLFIFVLRRYYNV